MFFYNISDRKYHKYIYYEQTSFSELKKYVDDNTYDGLLIYTYHTDSSSTSYIANNIEKKIEESDIVESYCIFDNKNLSDQEKIEIRRLKEINWTKPIIIIPLYLNTYMAKYTFFNDINTLKHVILNIDNLCITLETHDWCEKYTANNIVCHELLTHNDYFVESIL
jgi:hypothetical protein